MMQDRFATAVDNRIGFRWWGDGACVVTSGAERGRVAVQATWGMTQRIKEPAASDLPEFAASQDALEAIPSGGGPGTNAIVIDLRSGEPTVDDRTFISLAGGVLEAPRWARAAKRTLDIIGASLALIVLLPLMLLAALAVAFDSPGPVLFVQERVGLRGKPFRMLKFRSMSWDAEAQRDALQCLNEHEAGPIFKIRDDPRITAVGRTLRRFSIDEMPQLLNVLGGSMSLVGPRPPLPVEVQTYDAWEAQRLLTKPGITCIWQVSGRSELDFETWVRLDLEYIETWSLWLDLKLLGRTIPAVISARGAC